VLFDHGDDDTQRLIHVLVKIRVAADHRGHYFSLIPKFLHQRLTGPVVTLPKLRLEVSLLLAAYAAVKLINVVHNTQLTHLQPPTRYIISP